VSENPAKKPTQSPSVVSGNSAKKPTQDFVASGNSAKKPTQDFVASENLPKKPTQTPTQETLQRFNATEKPTLLPTVLPTQTPTQLPTIIKTRLEETRLDCCCTSVVGEQTDRQEGQDRQDKPTLEEIQNYCREENIVTDCEAFYDFNESRGWRVKGTLVHDWRVLLRRWASLDYGATARKSERQSIAAQTGDSSLNKDELHRLLHSQFKD